MPGKQAIRRRMHSGRLDSSKNCADRKFKRDPSPRRRGDTLIDPEPSPYTCMLPEHKPVRRGREMIDLLAVEEPKP